MSFALGSSANVGQLNANSVLAETLGTTERPVQNINMASEIVYDNDLKFVEQDNRHTYLKVKTDKHLQVTGELEFVNDNIDENSPDYVIGINPSTRNFVIHNETTGVDSMTIDRTTGAITFDPPVGGGGGGLTGDEFLNRWSWNTQGITQYNRSGCNLDFTGQMADPSSGQPRYDGVFYGAPAGPYAWNIRFFPTGPIPSNQVIQNTSTIPGSVIADGFTFGGAVGEKLPVRCTLSGSFFQTLPGPAADTELLSGAPGTGPFFMLRVGIVAKYFDGSNTIYVPIKYKDLTIPCRPAYVTGGDFVHFSETFVFEMTKQEPSGLFDWEYQPMYVHNGYDSTAPASTDIRWRELQVDFDTLKTI